MPVGEVEIKLCVPEAALAGVARALARGQCRTTRLHAIYFDTPDSRLAAAGWALRLRREGAWWWQTLKGPGANPFKRSEHESRRSRSRLPPALDLALLAGAPEKLRRLLDEAGPALAPAFEVDVRRTARTVRHGGARIELALDVGLVRAAGRTQPLCELELELHSGSPASLASLATTWSARHGLWMDPRTKSGRGERLRAGSDAPPPARVHSAELRASMGAAEALRSSIAAVVEPLALNLALIAAGEGQPEHLHQARVGMRRMLSLLRVFGAAVPAVDTRWIEGGRSIFGQLGAARDRDVLQAWLLPALRDAGGPPLALDDASAAVADPVAVCRSPALCAWLLALWGFAVVPAAPVDVPATPVATPATPDVMPATPDVMPASPGAHPEASLPTVLEALRPPLLALHRRLCRSGERFGAISDEQRHRSRKQLKRLRYAAEALAPLWPSAAWKAYEARLRSAQEALGRFNDLCVAQARLAQAGTSEPAAAFALGWLAANKPLALRRSAHALQRLGRAPKFLRSRARRGR